MARLATPTRELVTAMEELGHGAWIRGAGRTVQVTTAARPDELRLGRTLPSSGLYLRDEAFGDDAGVARLMRTLGTKATRAAVHEALPRRRERTADLPAPSGTAVGILLCGLGLLALGTLLATGPR